MVHKYQVTGMVCVTCEEKVKSALLLVENVTELALGVAFLLHFNRLITSTASGNFKNEQI